MNLLVPRNIHNPSHTFRQFLILKCNQQCLALDKFINLFITWPKKSRESRDSKTAETTSNLHTSSSYQSKKHLRHVQSTNFNNPNNNNNYNNNINRSKFVSGTNSCTLHVNLSRWNFHQAKLRFVFSSAERSGYILYK